jgi:hypothetical protein
MATPPRPHSLINLTVDKGRGSTRRRPAIHLITYPKGGESLLAV